MKAKTVNNFERGIDPKKAMGTGIVNYEGYVEMECKQYDIDPNDFWEDWNDNAQAMYDVNDLIELWQEAISNTPLKYQIDWIKSDLERYIEDHTD